MIDCIPFENIQRSAKKEFSLLRNFTCSNCQGLPLSPYCLSNERGVTYMCYKCLSEKIIKNDLEVLQTKIFEAFNEYNAVFKDQLFTCVFSQNGCRKFLNYHELSEHFNSCKFSNSRRSHHQKRTMIENQQKEERNNKSNNCDSELNTNELIHKINMRLNEQQKKIDELTAFIFNNMVKVSQEIQEIHRQNCYNTQEIKNSMKLSCSICLVRGKSKICQFCEYKYCTRCITECKICTKKICYNCVTLERNCEKNCENIICKECEEEFFERNMVCELKNSNFKTNFYRTEICNTNKCISCTTKQTCIKCNNSCCQNCFVDCLTTSDLICNNCFKKYQGSLNQVLDRYFPEGDSKDNSNDFEGRQNILLLGLFNGKLLDFNTETFEVINGYTVHNDKIRSIKQQNDRILTGSADGYLKIWNCYNFDNPLFQYFDSMKVFNEISDSIWLNDQITISACLNVNFCIMINYEEDSTLKLNYQMPKSICKINENLVLIGSDKSRISIWDLQSNSIIKEVESHAEKSVMNLIKTRNDNLFLSSGNDKTIKLWDSELRNILSYDRANYAISKIHELYDGRIVFGCNDSSIQLWDRKSDNFNNLKGHSLKLSDFCMKGEYYLFSSSFDKKVKLWDLRKNECITTKEFDSAVLRFQEFNNFI